MQRRLKQIREEAQSAANGVGALQQKRQDLKAKAANLAEAIATFGHSPSLLAQLAIIEAEISKIEDQISSLNQPSELAASLDNLRGFFCEKLLELRKVLRADVETARQAMAKHVQKLVLTPKQTSEGPVFEFPAMLRSLTVTTTRMGCVVMVARDGVEPPTPAFSAVVTHSYLLLQRGTPSIFCLILSFLFLLEPQNGAKEGRTNLPAEICLKSARLRVANPYRTYRKMFPKLKGDLNRNDFLALTRSYFQDDARSP